MLHIIRNIKFIPKLVNSQRPISDNNSENDQIRKNIVNIQMVSENFKKKLFGDKNNQNFMTSDIDKFEKFKIDVGKTTISKTVDFQLPDLLGENVDVHLTKSAESLNNPYLSLLKNIDKWSIPKMPQTWLFEEGWTKYDPENHLCNKINVPEEDLLIFDIETLPKQTQKPIMAVAVGEKYWYSWTNKCLLERGNINDSSICKDDLIPIYFDKNKSRPKCIVGHFVSFDRARIRDEYDIKGTGARYLDTMSLQIAIRGLTGLQRSLKNSFDKDQTDNKLWKDFFNDFQKSGVIENADISDKWITEASLNSLVDVYDYYYSGCDLSTQKDKRQTFIKGTVNDVVDDFQSLMTYCATDVMMTAKIFKKLWAEYRIRFPHPASFTGMLEMGSLYLPVNKNLHTYINRATTTYDTFVKKEKEILMELAKESLSAYNDKAYINDPWLWDLDWSFAKNSSTPKWYKELIGKTSEATSIPDTITSQKMIAVKMMKLKWDGLPLHYDKKYKWGILIPGKYDPAWNDSKYIDLERKTILSVIPVEKVSPSKVQTLEFPLRNYFDFWVPMFIEKLENFALYLTSEKGKLRNYRSFIDYMIAVVEMLNLSSENSLKINNIFDRIETITKNDTTFKQTERYLPNLFDFQMNQFDTLFEPSKTFSTGNPFIPFVWFVPLPHEDGEGHFVGSPLSKSFLNHLQSGRLTSHSVNNLLEIIIEGKKGGVFWQNYKNRIQSQFIVRASNDDSKKTESAIIPQVIVSGTVTRRSVERLWLTATNSTSDRIGSELKAMVQPPPGWVLVGADVDSQEQWIAAVLGDSVTGVHGGTPFGWLVLQGSKVDGTDLHSKTSKMIGISRNAAKVLNYSRMYGAGINSSTDTLLKFNPELKHKDAFNKIKELMKQTKGRRSHGRWIDGIESEVFSKLEEIAKSDVPVTPVLNARLSQSLEKRAVNDKFMTSKCNWVVQSSGVDYLHCLLTFAKILIQKYQVSARLCICIHDEIRYLCQEKDKYRLALILQIANLYTRSVFSMKLNLHDLPQSIAFFSEIEIDYCLRKNPLDDCVTPSNPDGLLKSYNIPKGESLNIYQILEKTAGKLN